jgi:hypothetical protein
MMDALNVVGSRCGIPGDDRCTPHNSSFYFKDGVGMHGMIMSYPKHAEVKGDGMMTEEFMLAINKWKAKKHHVMLVFEEFSGYSPKQIKNLADFLNPNWNVRVLVAYRPLYAWLPSVQNEINKHHVSSWPGSGAYFANIPFNLADPKAVSTIEFRAMQKYRKHPAEIVRDKYKKQFDDVELLLLHKLPEVLTGHGEPILVYIFCVVLKGLTDKTCIEAMAGRRVGNLLPSSRDELVNPSV